MENSVKKIQVEGGDKEILYSKTIKAGKRIYYLDVKKNLKDDLFLAVTESKKVQPKNGMQVSFEKHKIFLYKEDFDKFMNGLEQSIHFIQSQQGYHVAPRYAEKENLQEGTPTAAKDETSASTLDDEIKIDIDF